MAYVISDDCISCGTCAGECPVEAISEGAEHYQIDADACTESTIRSTLMLALSVVLAQVFAHLRLSAFPNAISY